MTMPQSDAPVTVRDLLLGGPEPDRSRVLAASLREHLDVQQSVPALHGLTETGVRAVDGQIATVVDGFLRMDLIDLLAGGWLKYQALTAAARRTRVAPGTQETVMAATHTVTSVHRPSVDVYLDGAHIGTLELELTVRFEIGGLAAVIELGRLAAVRAGSCTVAGRLAAEEVVLAERSSRIDLPTLWRARPVLALVPEST